MRTDTEATVELWQENANTYLARWSKAQERAIDAERERDSERALADRLAEAANAVIDQWDTPNWKLTEPTATCMNTLRNTLAAWKEVRDGSR